MAFYIKNTWTEKYECLYDEICSSQPKEQIRTRGPESLGTHCSIRFCKAVTRSCRLPFDLSRCFLNKRAAVKIKATGLGQI